MTCFEIVCDLYVLGCFPQLVVETVLKCRIFKMAIPVAGVLSSSHS